jgi:hypothetical protein
MTDCTTPGPSTDSPLATALIACINRSAPISDGVLLEHIGGRGLANLDPPTGSVGKRLDLVWPDQIAALVTQLTRRAIANRSAIDAQFRDGGVAYQVRVTAQGPDRAICVIRPASVTGEEDDPAPTAALPAQHLDRRGFLRRFKDSLSSAALRTSAGR